MPLNTQMIRDGKNISPTGKGWNGHDVNAMYTVAFGESNPEMEWNSDYTIGQILAEGKTADFFTMGLPYLLSDDKVPLSKVGKQTVKADHTFEGDEDGPLVFKKGDILKAWRD